MWAELLWNAALWLTVGLGGPLARRQKINDLVYKFLSRFSFSFKFHENRVVNIDGINVFDEIYIFLIKYSKFENQGTQNLNLSIHKLEIWKSKFKRPKNEIWENIWGEVYSENFRNEIIDKI